MNKKIKLPCESNYSKYGSKEEISKYTDAEYEDFAKKMDSNLLHQVSEQRCRPFGCMLQNCLHNFNNLNKCMTLYRQMNYCIYIERKKIIYEFKQTNKQHNY